MGRKHKLPVREDLDFAFLLELMPPLHNVPEYHWLPELFSIIGHEKLLTLCKYAGGETIRIPTMKELSDSIEALQWFYNIRIKQSRDIDKMPEHLRYLYDTIEKVYDDGCLKSLEKLSGE